MSEDPEYLIDQYRTLHARQPGYGPGPHRTIVDHLSKAVRHMNVHRVTDYGCGNSQLAERMFPDPIIQKLHFDPAIPEFSNIPPGWRSDLLLCTDVMEHVPCETIGKTFQIHRDLSRVSLYLIATNEAKQILPDGQNAHCTVRPREWWKENLERKFGNVQAVEIPERVRAWKTAFICS